MNYAIVGFGAAGFQALKAIRECGSEDRIDVYSDHRHPPYNPMLTTYYLKGKIPFQAMFPFGSLEEIRQTLQPDFIGIRENLSLIAVTGEKATESSDANVRVLAQLTKEGIEISTINQGAGKLNLLIGVPEERYEDAVRAIYRFRQENSPAARGH